jgi:hypothetical protein
MWPWQPILRRRRGVVPGDGPDRGDDDRGLAPSGSGWGTRAPLAQNSSFDDSTRADKMSSPGQDADPAWPKMLRIRIADVIYRLTARSRELDTR